ncbi:hypothetical protein AGOR_G00207830 [Albula goreensis]|uniref:Uncharacterized protein n=1 Tax=Albula goreensis TaxID=1534307 RepID=A0A8T3CP99_9TELE|nr:hypothetical protein AGOR_G00207830 [Albula goreensis]
MQGGRGLSGDRERKRKVRHLLVPIRATTGYCRDLEGEKGSETFCFPKYLVLGPNVVVAREGQSETEHSVNEWSQRKTDSHRFHSYFNRSQKN